MPQKLEDEVFKKFIYSISNHKTIESIQLMNFLLKRKTPRNIDLTYENYIFEMQQRFGGGLLQASMLMGTSSPLKDAAEEQLMKESIAKSMLKQAFKNVFTLHGAVDIDIPVLAPMQDSATIFSSMRQQKLTLDRRHSQHSDGSGHDYSSLGKDAMHCVEIDTVTSELKFQDQIVSSKPNQALLKYLKEKDIQRVTLVNLEPQLIAQRVLDDTGIVLQLQLNLTQNFARYVARKQPQMLKRYHIGKTFKKNLMYQRTSPSEFLEATFDIVSLPSGMHYALGDELLYEAEVIKVCDQIAQAHAKELGPRYKIRISSSEIIDGIMEEGRVKLENRHKVLKILGTMVDKQPWSAIRKELLVLNLVPSLHVDKIGDLLRIRGSLSQVEQLLKVHKALRKVDRFKKEIENFKSIRNYLKYFGVFEDIQAEALEEKQPQMKFKRKSDHEAMLKETSSQPSGPIIFDFGLILENQLNYYSGLIFKLVIPSTTTPNEEDQLFRSQRGGIGGRGGGLMPTRSHQDAQKNKFGLPTLAFNNLGVQNSQKQPGSARMNSNSQNYETLAIGGRYDNLIAHYQPVEIPIAVGVRFFCNKFLKKMLKQDTHKTSTIAPIDVYIVSLGDMTQEKIELVAEFWRHGVRAEYNQGSDFKLQDLHSHHSQAHQILKGARFLVTFKKATYGNKRQVKVKDLETKQEKDELREHVVESIKKRLSSKD